MRIVVEGQPRDIPMNQCDKCFQPVPPENDAVYLDGFATGHKVNLIFAHSRHFLPTEGCQGSPSRAQYIEGQPRDQRGYRYDEEAEPRFRAAFALLQVKYGVKQLTTTEASNILNVLGESARDVLNKNTGSVQSR